MTFKDQISNATSFDTQEDCESFIDNAITDARLAHGSAAANATTDRVIDELKSMPAEYTAAFVRFAIWAGIRVEQLMHAMINVGVETGGIVDPFEPGEPVELGVALSSEEDGSSFRW